MKNRRMTDPLFMFLDDTKVGESPLLSTAVRYSRATVRLDLDSLRKPFKEDIHAIIIKNESTSLQI